MARFAWTWVVLLVVVIAESPGGGGAKVSLKKDAMNIIATDGGSHHAHAHNTTNMHPRYQNVTKAAKTNVLVQLSITSSPHRAHLRAAGLRHARATGPCYVQHAVQ